MSYCQLSFIIIECLTNDDVTDNSQILLKILTFYFDQMKHAGSKKSINQ